MTKSAKITHLQVAKNKIQQLSALVSRMSLFSKMGKSYNDDRDVYEALGYPLEIAYEDYAAKYTRQDIAKRVVNAPASESWRLKPVITENETDETDFEKQWIGLEKDLSIYQACTKIDKLSGIGRYGVLLLGFDDNKDMSQPVTKPKQLLYLHPYSESTATVKDWEKDPTNKRFGLPLTYTIQTTIGDLETSTTLSVHHTRIVHVADGLLESTSFGTPRLEACYNRLMNLELLVGGSAEMFWRGAFPGFGLNADADADFPPESKTDMQDEMEEYLHGLKRYIRMQGIDVQQFAPQVADPSNHVDVQLTLISAVTGIPKRILVGSERGELASSQDESNWNKVVHQRRTEHCEPNILRPIIDPLIEYGILPEPQTGEYTIDWPDLDTPSDKDKADVSKVITEALAKYASSPGVDMLVPPEVYLKKVMGFSQEEIDMMEELIEDLKDEYEEEEEAQWEKELEDFEARDTIGKRPGGEE